MKDIIQLKSKEDFKKCKDEFKNKSNACWKLYMWDLFEEQTCYYVVEDCFISFDRAIQLNLITK